MAHLSEQHSQQLNSFKQNNETIVFTNGCFDILHAGHITYLQEAKDLGTKLIVGLNSDLSVKKIKGDNRPIVPDHQRQHILESLTMVDMVIPFDEDTPIELLKTVQPNIHVKGGDYKIEELPEYDTINSYGGQIKILSFVPNCSTSLIIEKILTTYGNH